MSPTSTQTEYGSVGSSFVLSTQKPDAFEEVNAQVTVPPLPWRCVLIKEKLSLVFFKLVFGEGFAIGVAEIAIKAINIMATIVIFVFISTIFVP